MASSGQVPCTLFPAAADWDPNASSTQPDPNALVLVNQPNLQVMSPNEGPMPQVAMKTTTTSIMFHSAQEVPVPEDSISYHGSSSMLKAVENDEPEDRRVRRRTSPVGSALTSKQPDSPHTVAMKNEIAQKDASIALLRQQLMGVQSLAMSELQAQRNAFGGAITIYENKAREIARTEVEQAKHGLSVDYSAEISQLRLLESQSQSEHEAQLLLTQNQIIDQMHDKVRFMDLLNEENYLNQEIQSEAEGRSRISNEENSELQSQIDALNAELARLKPSTTTSTGVTNHPANSDRENLFTFKGASSILGGTTVHSDLNKVPVFNTSDEQGVFPRASTDGLASDTAIPKDLTGPSMADNSQATSDNPMNQLMDELNLLRKANEKMEHEMKYMQWIMGQNTASAANPADSEHFDIGEGENEDEHDQSFTSAHEMIKEESPPRPNAITSDMTVQKSTMYRDARPETKADSAGGNEPVPSSALPRAAPDAGKPAVGSDGQDHVPDKRVGSTDDSLPRGTHPHGKSLPNVSLPTTVSSPVFVSPQPCGAGAEGESSVPVYKQKIKEADSIAFDPLPHIKDLRFWKIKSYKKIAAASGRGALGMQWAKKAEEVSSIEDLASDGPGMENFSAIIASALLSLISGELKRKVTMMEEKLMAEGQLLNGRQLLFLVFQEYKRNPVEVGMTEFRDLQNLRLKGENLRAFIDEWDMCLDGMVTQPTPAVKETLFEDQIRQCRHFETTFELYVTKCTHDGLERGYATLREWVLAYLERRKQQRITDQASRQNGNAHSSVQPNKSSPLTSGANQSSPLKSGANRQPGDCWQMRDNGKCSRGAKCPFAASHERLQKAFSQRPGSARRSPSKGKGKGKSRSPSRKPSRDRSTPDGKGKGKPNSSKGKSRGTPRDGFRGKIMDGVYTSTSTRESSRGKSPSGNRDRQPCKFHIRGCCSKGTECDDWHIPDCRFYKLGKCAANPCVFLHRNDNGNVVNTSAKPSPKEQPKRRAKAKAKADVAFGSLPLE